MAEIESFMLAEIEADLGAGDPAVRRQALELLSRMRPDERVLMALMRVADDDADDELRYRASRLHAKFRRELESCLEDSQPVIVNGRLDESRFHRVMREGEAFARIEAINALVSTADRDRLPLILEYLNLEKDNWVVATLVKAAGFLGSASTIASIQRYLKHVDGRVQANAIEALEAIGDPVIVPLLVPMLNARDKRTKANAIKALVKYDQDHAVSVLEKMALSRDKSWMRDSAVYCLSFVRDARVELILLKMLEREDNMELMKREAQLLASIGGEQVLAPLNILLRKSGRDKMMVLKYALREIAIRHGVDGERMKTLTKSFLEKIDSPAGRDGKKDDDSGHRFAGKHRGPASRPQGKPARHDDERWFADYRYRLTAAAGVFLLIVFSVVPALFHTEADSAVSGTGAPGRGRQAIGSCIAVSGRVDRVDREKPALLVRSAGRLYLARISHSMLKGARRGRELDFRGKVTGWSAFGGIYVDVDFLKFHEEKG